MVQNCKEWYRIVRSGTASHIVVWSGTESYRNIRHSTALYRVVQIGTE